MPPDHGSGRQAIRVGAGTAVQAGGHLTAAQVDVRAPVALWVLAEASEQDRVARPIVLAVSGADRDLAEMWRALENTCLRPGQGVDDLGQRPAARRWATRWSPAGSGRHRASRPPSHSPPAVRHLDVTACLHAPQVIMVGPREGTGRGRPLRARRWPASDREREDAGQAPRSVRRLHGPTASDRTCPSLARCSAAPSASEIVT